MNPLGDGLFCATQVAWSPDSTRIAVVGHGVNCSGAGPGRTPGLILVYAVASGKLIQKLQPDTAVLALPAIAQQVDANSAAGGMISTLTYDNLTWTPDGQALLMTFDLELLPNLNSGSTGVFGLLRLGATDPSLTQAWLDTSASHIAQMERWNLLSGAADTLPAPAKSTDYQWNADGTLAPAGLAGQPVGVPDGGKTFTVWQPGRLQFGTNSDKASESTTVLAQDIGWVSYASPVSPDGHYFYPDMINAGSLVPPSTQHAVVGEPVLQPHDQALAALAQQLMQTPSPSQNTSILVAWRPDGSYLAAFASDAAAPSPTAFTISIYDTANGKLVKQVMPDFTGLSTRPAGSGASVALLWSPDGSRLLLVDNVYGVITVWGPGALSA
jgi:WD40 repeat protein